MNATQEATRCAACGDPIQGTPKLRYGYSLCELDYRVSMYTVYEAEHMAAWVAKGGPLD